MDFKSPQVHLIGKIKQAIGFAENNSSLYAKIDFLTGQSWKLLNGKSKFQTFQAECFNNLASFEQPFDLHYISQDVRGWPRILIQIWIVDSDSRHTIIGYGTIVCPFASGQYELYIPCWRPKGTWFDNFIGAHSELQNKNILLSSLSRYGLKTFSTGKIKIQLKVLSKDFNLHGVKLK